MVKVILSHQKENLGIKLDLDKVVGFLLSHKAGGSDKAEA